MVPVVAPLLLLLLLGGTGRLLRLPVWHAAGWCALMLVLLSPLLILQGSPAECVLSRRGLSAA